MSSGALRPRPCSQRRRRAQCALIPMEGKRAADPVRLLTTNELRFRAVSVLGKIVCSHPCPHGIQPALSRYGACPKQMTGIGCSPSALPQERDFKEGTSRKGGFLEAHDVQVAPDLE